MYGTAQIYYQDLYSCKEQQYGIPHHRELTQELI